MNKNINPNLKKLAELTYNPDLKVDKTMFEKQEEVRGDIEAPSLDGFVYVPSINLYVAKERSLCEKNWYDTHKALDKQGLFMPTIPQFIEFIKYLRNGYSDRKEAEGILDEILTVRDPWRSEWLDADFKVKNSELYINFEHRIVNGNLQPLKSEKLENCLMKDKAPGIDLDYWLNIHTKHGLPFKNCKDGDLYYWAPMRDNNSVARFVADSYRAYLLCDRLPSYSDASLGVFACAEGTRAKI